MNNAKKAAFCCAYAGSLVTVVPRVSGNVGLSTSVGLQQHPLPHLLEPLLEQPVVFDIPRGGGGGSSSSGDNGDSSHRKKASQDENRSRSSSSSRKKSSGDKKKSKKDRNNHESSSSSASAQQEQDSTPPNPVLEEILQQENYYKMLGLMQGESDLTKIKKAYRRRAVQTHPDKTGGDRRAFDKVAEAYDVLSDDNKRSLYNQFGKKGVQAHEEGGASTTTAESLFRSFFGSSSPFFRGHHQEDPRQQQAVRYQLEITLEELYQGVNRSVFVAQPPSSSNSQEYFQQAEPKKIQVTIPRGTLSGSTIVVTPGDIDGAPTDWEDDLLFWVKQRPHPVFTRKNHDLAIQVHISLQEAICGVTRSIVHLDGKTIHLGSARQKSRHGQQHHSEEEAESHHSDDPPSQYIQSGDVHVWKGKGMPKDAEGTEYGDLYVQYHVEIPRAGHPEHLTHEEREELARLLQKYEGRTIKQSHIKKSKKKHAADVHYLQRASIAEFGRASASGPEDGHRHHDQHHQQHHSFPFGGHRQFFFSSSGGSSPFFGQETNFEEDDNVQCRSM